MLDIPNSPTLSDIQYLILRVAYECDSLLYYFSIYDEKMWTHIEVYISTFYPSLIVELHRYSRCLDELLGDVGLVFMLHEESSPVIVTMISSDVYTMPLEHIRRLYDPHIFFCDKISPVLIRDLYRLRDEWMVDESEVIFQSEDTQIE